MDRKSGTRSEAGWAIFNQGRLESSGVILLDGVNKKERLAGLAKTMYEEFNEFFDLLVLEDIWGYIASQTLVQACGVIIGNTNAVDVIELNIATWQAIANRVGGWTKGDESDAIYIGVAALVLSEGYSHKKFKKEDERQAQIQQIMVQNEFWGVDLVKDEYERSNRRAEEATRDSEEAGAGDPT